MKSHPIIQQVNSISSTKFKVNKEWPDVSDSLLYKVSLRLYGTAHPNGSVLAKILSDKTGLNQENLEVICQLSSSASTHQEAKGFVTRWFNGTLTMA